MIEFNAGKFKVRTWGPYPFWILVHYEGKEVVRIRHDEAKDLRYVLERLDAQMRPRLGKDAHELD